MECKRVLLIGGSGFVGSWLAGRLSSRGIEVIIPTRHRDNSKRLALLPTVSLVEADVNDKHQLAALMLRVDAVINLVGILHDSDSRAPYGKHFAAAHVDLPKKIVAAMRQNGVRRLVHMSALRAAGDAPSAYLRSKAAGETVVLSALNDIDATVFQPSVIFGPGDAFLNTFATLLRLLPVFPLAGATARFQPVFVGDVADVFVDALNNRDSIGQTYELAGPQVYALGNLVRYVGKLIGKPAPVIALPDFLARVQAAMLGMMPKPLMSPDNLRSLQVDSVSNGKNDYPGWQPEPLEAVAPSYLSTAKGKLRFGVYRARAGR